MIAKPKKRSEFIVDTQAEVARFFGCSERNVRTWAASGMPGSQGDYDLRDIAAWIFKKRRNDWDTGSGGGDGASLGDQIKLAELELTQERAREKRRENEIAEGNLIPNEQVEQWATIAIVESREALMGVPDALAASVEPAHREFVRSESDRRIRLALEQFRRKLEERPHVETASDGPD